MHRISRVLSVAAASLLAGVSADARAEDLQQAAYAVSVQYDVVYASGQVGASSGKPHARGLRMDVYRPLAVGKPLTARPAVVLAFGGGLHRGSKGENRYEEDGASDTPMGEYCRAFASAGYVCSSIEYRLVPEDPVPPRDIDMAKMLPKTTLIEPGLTARINSVRGWMGLANIAPAHLRERYLPGVLAGKVFGSFGISEPDVGSNVIDIKTKGVRDGDHWVISGEKTWITGGHYSDFFICTTRTSEKGLSHFIIDREEHGYETRNIEKIALNSQSTAQIFITEARVPHTNMCGEEGIGLKNTVKEFEMARPHVGLLSIGLMRAALEETIAYATQRKQFGKVIAAHQLVAAKIAEMATMLDASKLMCYRALSMIDMGVRCDLQSSMAKWFATEAAVKVCRDAVQIHGGNGLTKEFNVERLAREAIVIPIPDGTTEIQKLIIARGLTGVSAF